MSVHVDLLTSQYAYVLFALLLGVGLYTMVASPNLVKKVIGLNLFQTALFLLFIASAYVAGGQAPVLEHGGGGGEHAPYVSPLPHVLVLTAIVVGVALTAVALALLVRIYTEYGTLQEDVLREVRSDE